MMGIGVGTGENRAVEAARAAVMSPLLEVNITGARGILFNVTGGSDLGLFEVNEAAEVIKEAADPEANIIFGTVIDDRMRDEVKVTVIATGFDGTRKVKTNKFGADASAGIESSLDERSREILAEIERDREQRQEPDRAARHRVAVRPTIGTRGHRGQAAGTQATPGQLRQPRSASRLQRVGPRHPELPPPQERLDRCGPPARRSSTDQPRVPGPGLLRAGAAQGRAAASQPSNSPPRRSAIPWKRSSAALTPAGSRTASGRSHTSDHWSGYSGSGSRTSHAYPADRPSSAPASADGPAPEIEVVERVARLLEVGALLQELAEEGQILVLDAELGRPGLGIDRFVVLPLAAEQGHVRSSDRSCWKPGQDRRGLIPRSGHPHVRGAAR